MTCSSNKIKLDRELAALENSKASEEVNSEIISVIRAEGRRTKYDHKTVGALKQYTTESLSQLTKAYVKRHGDLVEYKYASGPSYVGRVVGVSLLGNGSYEVQIQNVTEQGEPLGDIVSYVASGVSRLEGSRADIFVTNIKPMLDSTAATLKPSYEKPSISFNPHEEMMKALNGELGSYPSEESLKDLANYSRVDMFSTETAEAMSATLEMMQGLNKNKVSEQVMGVYRDLLKTFKPEFFHKMELFLQEAGETTNGWFVSKQKQMFIKASKLKSGYQTPAEVYMHELVHAMTYWGLRNGGREAATIRRELRYAQLAAQKSIKVEDLLSVSIDAATKADWAKARELYKYLFTGENSLDEFVAYAVTNPKLVELLSKAATSREKSDSTLLQHVMTWFGKLVDVIMGRQNFASKDKNLQEQIVSLALRLGEINAKGEIEASKLNPLSFFSSLVNKGLDVVDSAAANAMHAAAKKVLGESARLEDVPENSGPLQRGLWYLRFTGKALTSKVHRDVMLAWASSWMMGMKPEGDIRQFFSDLFPEDEGKAAATWLTLKAEKLDALRNSEAYATKARILEGFNRPLSEEQEEALTSVIIDTDIGHMLSTKEGRKGIDNARLRELLVSDAKLDSAINNVRRNIKEYLGKDQARANVVKSLAQELGYYMATGNSSVTTVFSAKGIVRGHGTVARYKDDQKLHAMVKELSSLVAIKYTDKKERELVEELLVNEREGVYRIIDTYEGFKASSKQELFQGDETHAMEGYSKELFDSSISSRVARVSEREEMEKLGFKLVGKVKVGNATQRMPMGLYVSESHSKAERQRGALSLSNLAAKGTSMRDIAFIEDPVNGNSYFQRDKAVADLQAVKDITAMAKGNFSVENRQVGMAAIRDANGKIVDYRHMMDKRSKKELLKQDRRVSEVLGWTVASVQNKVLKEAHEDLVLDTIKKGMGQWKGGVLSGDTGYEEFDLIGPYSADPEMVELYYMLPKKFQEFINNRADKTMAVPRRLRPIYFGYKHAKLSNAVLINKLSPQIKALIDSFESLWFDLVSLAKGTILIKMPWVITTNLISNFIQLFTMGVGLTESLKLHTDSFRDIKQFLNHSKEKAELEGKIREAKAKMHRIRNKGTIAAEKVELNNKINTKEKQKSLLVDGVIKSSIEKEIISLQEELEELNSITRTSGDKLQAEIEHMEIRVRTIEDQLAKNPVKELVDVGLMQTLIEDVQTAAMNDNNRISQGIDKVMGRAPAAVRYGADVLYMTSNTRWYKTLQEVLQLSDLIARDVLNRKMKIVEKERMEGKKDYQPEMVDEMAKYGVTLVNGVEVSGQDKAIYEVVANKNRLQTLKTRFINYTQPNGKYEEWANKAGILMFTKYFKRIQREILAMGGDNPVRAALGAAIAIGGLDTVQGQSFIIKGEGFDGSYSLGNLVPIYNPLDVALTVAMPPLIRLGDAAVN